MLSAPGFWDSVGTLIFNLAMTSALPSWLNEKQPDVSVAMSLSLSLGYVACLYLLIGIVGGMAFPPFFKTDENLFSKLHASGLWLPRMTVLAYPICQNFTTIPVIPTLCRCMLLPLDPTSCTPMSESAWHVHSSPLTIHVSSGVQE